MSDRTTSALLVTTSPGVTAISAGANDGYAVNADGMVSAWGDNSETRLGGGSSAASSNNPVLVGVSGAFSLGGGPVAYTAYAVV